ncbi:hypothetical protein FAES_3695 [Fibrella aestuarina BUZ 2]|uniref:Uncharacterized protein n=1 Tax=Fibrella aestuarina BUZ 2 TaxID=1166018 RepID=I0KC49_9BACT|nr:hypothetical protein [Fibrella aestuarina]CCH01702.1 hypothetical protein FAES_3695 [Fibrella aestuarina BUZ 2]
MKRLLSLSLLALLLYHTLATVWVAVGVWWHDQRDLSKHLTVYSSVDSMVEFQVVLGNTNPASGQAQQLTAQTLEDGFAYHDKFYDVISVELHGDTLRIAGMEDKAARFWQQDLLSFVKKTISQPTDESSRKAGQWLKLLLKEYHLATPFTLSPSLVSWLVSLRIPDTSVQLVTRALSVVAPPPRG